MKKHLLFVFLLSMVSIVAVGQNMTIVLKNGNSLSLPVGEIDYIDFPEDVPAGVAALGGRWRLIASANGVVGAGGVYTAITDTIDFYAVVGADGHSLVCHADAFYTRSGQIYPADWRVEVETSSDGQVRLGWVLDDQTPVSEREFMESEDKYLEEGFFYFGVSSSRSDTGHRYLYLLSENIDTQRLEGMTLWSGWVSEGAKEFLFPQSQQVYGVVALDCPYSYTNHSSVGYIDIWASARMQKR